MLRQTIAISHKPNDWVVPETVASHSTRALRMSRCSCWMEPMAAHLRSIVASRHQMGSAENSAVFGSTVIASRILGFAPGIGLSSQSTA